MRLSLKKLILGLLVVGLSSVISMAFAQSFSVHIPVPPAVSTNGQVEIDDYSPSGPPGAPALPTKTYNIALPPEADLQTVNVEPTGFTWRELSGTYEISSAPEPVTWVYDEQTGKWKKVLGTEGMPRPSVYGIDAYYPESPVQVVSRSQMRKWKFVQVAVTPCQWNPVSKKMRCVDSLELVITYKTKEFDTKVIQDTAFDEMAKDMFYNYGEAKAWYKPKGALPQAWGANYFDYVIITTDDILNGSSKLKRFVTHKAMRGHSPLIVTETKDGVLSGGWGGMSGTDNADKIRNWLRTYYLQYGIKYVLLIGNPDPTSGDIIMKMCYPRHGQGSYEESPTDYYYADLTGDWNSDGDGYYGEYPDDSGVDFCPEVFVGRIPVYGTNYTSLDNILQKIMDYENASDLSYRKKALLPEAVSGYADGCPPDIQTDGADLGEDMVDRYLDHLGFSWYRLYEKAGIAPSPYSCEANLTEDNVIDEWQNGYGLVCWWAHGDSTGAYRYVWDHDDGDCVLESGEDAWYNLFTSSDCSYLDDTKPAHVYQCSCLNGYPENSSNLGYSLLKHGAISTVSASRVSWYAGGWTNPLIYYADNASIGYYYMRELAYRNNTGPSLFYVKANMGNDWGGSSWMNKFDFNLYGDPANNLYSKTLWKDWISCNGQTIAKVGIDTGPGDSLHMVVRTGDGSIWYRERDNGGNWSDWQFLNGKTSAAPAIAVDGERNEVHVVVRGTDGKIWYRMRDSSGTWGSWQYLGGYCSGAPAIDIDEVRGNLHLAVKGTDGKIWYRMRDSSGTWGSWQYLDGYTSHTPAIAVDEDNNYVHVVVRTMDGKIYYRMRGSSGSWQSWQYLDGYTSDTPAIAVEGGTDTLHVVVRAGDNKIYYRWMDDWGNWSSWEFLGGLTYAAPAIATEKSVGSDYWNFVNRGIHVIATGSDGVLWYKNKASDRWSTSQTKFSDWSGWKRVGAPAVSSPPSIAVDTSNNVYVATRAKNSNTIMLKIREGSE